jgi:hypothetical protein
MNIFDFVTKTFDPCPEEQIRAAETSLGFSFSDWYVRFLRQSNGAVFKYSFLGGMMLPFVGLASLEYSIEMHEEFNFHEMGLFPIGNCDGAAVICFDVHNYHFFHYDIELSENTYIADTLEQFLIHAEKSTADYYASE